MTTDPRPDPEPDLAPTDHDMHYEAPDPLALRLVALLGARATNLSVADEPFDPRHIPLADDRGGVRRPSEAGAPTLEAPDDLAASDDLEAPNRRVWLAVASAAAILIAVLGGTRLAGRATTTDAGASMSVASGGTGQVLMPSSTPDGFVPWLAWSSVPVSTMGQWAATAPITNEQLIESPSTGGAILLTIERHPGGASPSSGGGSEPILVRGRTGTADIANWPGGTAEATRSGLLPLPSIMWHETADVTVFALVRGVGRTDAVAVIDALSWSGGSDGQGDLVTASPAWQERKLPGTFGGRAGPGDLPLGYAPDGGSGAVVLGYAREGETPSTTPLPLTYTIEHAPSSSDFFGTVMYGRVRSDGAAVWVTETAGVGPAEATSITLARPDGAVVRVTAARSTGLGAADVEALADAVTPQNATAFITVRDQVDQALQDLPTIASVDLGGARVDVKGSDGVGFAACVSRPGDPVRCVSRLSMRTSEAGISGGFVLGGTWFVLGASTEGVSLSDPTDPPDFDVAYPVQGWSGSADGWNVVLGTMAADATQTGIEYGTRPRTSGEDVGRPLG